MENYMKKIMPIFIGQTFSLLTSAIVQYAVIWYITFTTGSALYLAIATIAGILPQIIVGPFAGVLIDRWNRKRVMIFADLFVAIATVGLVIMFAIGEVSITGICIILAVRALGSAFHSPSLQASIPLIVPEDKLTRVSGINQTLTSLTTILAPILAGILYGVWKIEFIILLDLIGAVIGVCTLLPIKIPKQEIRKEKLKIFSEMKEGFMEIKSSKFLTAITLFIIIVSVIFMPIGSLFPLMTSNFFNLQPIHASIAETAFSVGMLIGGIIFAIWGGFKKKQYTLIFSMLILGIGLLVAGFLSPSMFVLFVIATALMGTMAPFFNGIYIAMIQIRIKPEKLGRVFSIITSLMLLATPIGLLVSAPVAEKIGVEKWFFISGVIMVIACILALISKTIREEKWEKEVLNEEEI